MNLKLKSLVAIALCSISTSMAVTTSDKDEKLLKIIDRLTIEEKVGQLNLISIEGTPTAEQEELIRKGLVGSVLKSNGVEQNLRLQKIAVEQSNAGIPILFQEDVIHGYRTITPIPLAESASWDMEAIKSSAATAARETASSGVMLTYAPMVDVARDPRWGRVLETSGEDPYLGAQVAKARVHGFQEGNRDPQENILACVKHFAGYGASLAGRDYNIQDISERELREVHLPPFQAAVDAGVATLMCAYTMYNGQPLTTNSYMLKHVLRDEMGFKGLVMTDWSTIPNVVKIGICANNKEATALALKSGIDMDMTSAQFVKHLPALVKEGVIDEKLIDEAVYRVLELKQRVGILDNHYAYMDIEKEQSEILSERNRAEAKDIALKSMVLLKNDQSTLPIAKNGAKRIAVIGPLATARKDLLGWWAAKGQPSETETILEAIEKKYGNSCKIDYAQGCIIDSFDMAGRHLIPAAVKIAKRADIAIVVLGERMWMSGEGGGVASLELPGAQMELLEAIAKTDTPIASVIVSGRPYILTDVEKHSDAIIEAWMPGTMGAEALADIIAGEFNPCGKLPITMPLHQGQVPIYYGYKRTSHTMEAGPASDRYTNSYRDIENKPLYPFGYGLSYTTYDYSDITLSSNEMSRDGSIEATVTVTNSGEVAGREVVQLYIGDKICSVVRPEKELKDFAIVELEPAQSKEVTFKITADKLSFIGLDYSRQIEAGEFMLAIGASSNDYKQTHFTLK